MIAKLRWRITLLIFAVLILVSAGIVVSINYMNWRNITQQAESALEVLSANSGKRPRLHNMEQEARTPGPGTVADPPGVETEGILQMPEDFPDFFPSGQETGTVPETSADGEISGNGDSSQEPLEKKERPDRGQPMDSGNVLADLGNYYVVRLAEDGSVSGWESDRAELYSDEQVGAMTELVLSSSKTQGRIGTQFFRITESGENRQLIVLDERLEIRNALEVLRTTALIAGFSCLLLCIAAYFLIGFLVKPVKEAFDRQRQFVWDASHELKTPLAVIGANAQVLQGEIGDNEYLNYIHSEVNRTNDLLSGLLTLARMDHGTVQVKLEQKDFGKVILEAALPFESAAFEADKTFETDVQEGILCQMDAAMIQQVVVILLSNALKYSDEHGTIRVWAGVKGKNRELVVSNTGSGIRPEDLNRIFDRFYRADSSHNREVEGYGLGLSIARNIVEAHHGKIHAESESGGLTRFIVSLPG